MIYTAEMTWKCELFLYFKLSFRNQKVKRKLIAHKSNTRVHSRLPKPKLLNSKGLNIGYLTYTNDSMSTNVKLSQKLSGPRNSAKV